MPRIRYLKPEFFEDEDIAQLPHTTRLTYQGLWVLSDREGRLENKPNWIKIKLFPYEDVDMGAQLQILEQKPFIFRYTTRDNLQYIQIINFNKHQKPHHTEKASIIPIFDKKYDTCFKEKEKEKDKVTASKLEGFNVVKTVNSTLTTQKRFKPPTIEEFNSYCIERNYDIDPEQFINYYTANGWKVGRNPMKNWKAAAANWMKNKRPEGIKASFMCEMCQNTGIRKFNSESGPRQEWCNCGYGIKAKRNS